jgi:hypothetical protein
LGFDKYLYGRVINHSIRLVSKRNIAHNKPGENC